METQKTHRGRSSRWARALAPAIVCTLLLGLALLSAAATAQPATGVEPEPQGSGMPAGPIPAAALAACEATDYGNSFATASLITPGVEYQGCISTQPDKDYFRFSVNPNTIIRVELFSLPKNYDLYLYNLAPAQIDGSTNGGTTWAMKDSVNAPALTWTDVGPGLGQKCYRVAASNCMGLGVYTTQACATLTGILENSSVPKEFKLFQNSPNPFNPVTKINYELPKDGKVKLVIYDILGREIKTLVNELKQAGRYTIEFNGTQYASGVYFYRIQVEGGKTYTSVKKMVLIK